MFDWDSFTGDTIYVDSNIIIFSVEAGNPWSQILKSLFQFVDERRIHLFTSELTLAEVLVKPIADGAQDLIGTYERFLDPASIIKVVSVDRPVLRLAAELQAQLGVKLADAIHVATAKLNACQFFLTNDIRLGSKLDADMPWLNLVELGERS